MGLKLQRSRQIVGEPVDINKLGAMLMLGNEKEYMRMVTCPRCNVTAIANKESTHVRCSCGVLISLKERWYE